MKCKFCGCTDLTPCKIPIIDGPDGDPQLAGDLQPATGVFACGWLIPGEVCTAPRCVEKAYAEARPLAEQIDQALAGMEDAA